MNEKIGQVTLDYTYYPGEDLYSDGEIEDEMLEIARSYPPCDFNRIIAERKSWPILYHFSHIRENIVSWLPFTGKEQVLEIGSGCGAVTGALCSKAESVTCIELSKKRSEINAWRHKDQENLTILVGNFQEIEKTLTQKYDYITLIGVFEYGESYINSENPYVDFLKIITRHLKPDGKIILAIENRFGLKYWAGCTEDHFGTMFEGLEGYPTTSGVKTFTKKEFQGILKAAGDLKATWYYPFPDYKFPMTVHSDNRLPARGELNRMEYNFDRLRMTLFQESAVYDSLLDNDLYPQFSNSFLLFIESRESRKETIGNQEESPETIYSKFSNERAPEFNIRTDICKDKTGRLFVKKLPSDERASAHVQNLADIAKKLEKAYEKEGLTVNSCTCENDGVVFEYLEGITLEEKLDTLLEKGKIQELEELLFSYVDKITNIHQDADFEKTQEFIQVFGDEPLPAGLKCGGISNIDLVPANIFLVGEKAAVIDYEWTFSFPIPAHFIIYRMLHYYLESDGKRHVLKELDLYKKAGITQEEQEMYARMETNFQKYMLGNHTPMLSMYKDISPGKAEVMSYYQDVLVSGAERTLQVFFDKGGGFSEENSCRCPMEKWGIRTEIAVPAGTTCLRLDPGEAKGAFRVRNMSWKNAKDASFVTNGFRLSKERYYFGGGDPQLILEKIPQEGGTLVLELEVLDEQKARKEFWSKFAQTEREKDAQIQRLKRKIHEMENTKVWKLYRSLKKES